MKNLTFNENVKFSTTAMVVLTSVCVLISVFAVIGTVSAGSLPNGSSCSINSDCSSNDCVFGTCLAQPYSSCDSTIDCTGTTDNSIMGCYSGQCKGRHFYPCGDYREDPVCGSDFHCDISGTLGYNYCEQNHPKTPVPTCSISANPTSIINGNSSLLTWTSTNATSCTASNAWSGSKSISGNQSVSPGSNSTYALTCTGAGGTVNCSAHVTVTTVDQTLSCSVAANPNNGTEPLYGVDLTADVFGTATGTINYKFDCTNNGTWDHVFDNISNDPKTVTDACNYSSAGTYTARVMVERGSASAAYCQTTINVQESHNPDPTCSIYASPSSITNGNYSNLNWSSTNASYCTASNAWSGSKSTSGNQSVSPGSNSTYTLTCYGYNGGSDTCSTTVYVNNDNNVDCSIYASPSSITNGNYSNLNWSSTNASYCTASNAWSGSKSTSGNQSVSPGSNSTYTLTCYGYNGGSDTCSTTVYVNNVYNNPNLRIEKLVRNVSNNNSSFFDSVSAEPGDEIEFLIRVTSIGTSNAIDVRVKDELPSGLNYISGTTTIDGSYYGDGVVNGWISLGTISQNNTREIKFKTKVSSSIGGTSANSLIINVESQNTQLSNNVSLNKSARNVTRGNGEWANSVSTYYGDVVEFSMKIANNTNNSITNVKVQETIPAKLSYVANSTTVDGAYWGGDVIGAGLNLGTLSPGQSKTIKFRVVVTEKTSGAVGLAGPATLINTAYVIANGISQLYDTAVVNVSGESGDVLGASTVITGAGTFGLVLLIWMSMLVALWFYCKTRETKLSEYLARENGNKLLKTIIGLYFKLSLRLKLMTLRFKQVYL